MNTYTNMDKLRSVNSEKTVSYGQQQHKLIEQLTFTEDEHLNLHCVELDFPNIEHQNAFLDLNEREIASNSQISLTFSNPYFPDADFLVLTHKNEELDYQLYITFERETWQHQLQLDSFSKAFVEQLNQSGYEAKVELLEMFGTYLSVHFCFQAQGSIKQRLRLIASDLQKTMDNII